MLDQEDVRPSVPAVGDPDHSTTSEDALMPQDAPPDYDSIDVFINLPQEPGIGSEEESRNSLTSLDADLALQLSLLDVDNETDGGDAPVEALLAEQSSVLALNQPDHRHARDARESSPVPPRSRSLGSELRQVPQRLNTSVHSVVGRLWGSDYRSRGDPLTSVPSNPHSTPYALFSAEDHAIRNALRKERERQERGEQSSSRPIFASLPTALRPPVSNAPGIIRRLQQVRGLSSSSGAAIRSDTVGSPLLNIISQESLLDIVDVLCFPDAFALAMTCRAVHAAIDLASRKDRYRRRLRELLERERGPVPFPATTEPGGPAGLSICDACLYALDKSYFHHQKDDRQREPDGAGGAPSVATTAAAADTVCRDCREFRQRVAADQRAHVTWRPSRRVVVKDTGGFLWYRQRA